MANHSQNIGIIDFKDAYGLISVQGRDAALFLQGQLTADIREITTNQPAFSAYCNHKGRIRTLCRIFLLNDTYYLQLPQSLISSILTLLKQMAKFSKVSINAVGNEWRQLGIIFPTSETHALKFLSEITHKNPDIIQIPYPDSSDHSRITYIGSQDILNPYWEKLTKAADRTTFEVWKSFDIKAGIPEIFPETFEKFLPHYLNLPALGAVSFKKGCYCGQEIIARMEYRTTIKRHLYCAVLFEANEIPLPGTPIWIDNPQQESVGTVVNAVRTAETSNAIEMLIEILDSVLENHQKPYIAFKNLEHHSNPKAHIITGITSTNFGIYAS